MANPIYSSLFNPINKAIEVWLAFYENLPQPITALFNLVLFLMIIFFVFEIMEKAGN